MAESQPPSPKSSTLSDAGRGPSSSNQPRRLHRKKEGPERGIACTTCRIRKQKCDRKQPSCTYCVGAYDTCIYVRRKQKATAAELEDQLRRLQHEYSIHLGLAHEGRPNSQQSTPRPLQSSASTVTSREINIFEEAFSRSSRSTPQLPLTGPSTRASSEGDFDEAFTRAIEHMPLAPGSRTSAIEGVIFNASFANSAQPSSSGPGWITAPVDLTPRAQSTSELVPYNGYVFDESFLTMPTFNVPQEQTASCRRDSDTAHASGPQYTTHSNPPAPQSPPCSQALTDEPLITSQEPLDPVFPTPVLEATKEPTANSRVGHQTPCLQEQPPLTMVVDSWISILPVVDEEKAEDDISLSHRHSQSDMQVAPVTDITQEPSMKFSRATWWDYLLKTYAIRPGSSMSPVTRRQRGSINEISTDVRRFFKIACFQLHFLNVPLFFDVFYHNELRSSIQPALVLSILGFSKLVELYLYVMQGGSHDDAEGERIWKQSIMLKDLGQAAFEASYNAGWIDLPLAQAAWILLLYELSAHKDSSPARKKAAFVLLDNIIRALRLTTLDAMDPRAPTFSPDTVPALGRPAPNGSPTPNTAPHMKTAKETRTMTTALYGSPSPRLLPIDATYRYQASMPPDPFDMWVDRSFEGLKTPSVYPVASTPAIDCPCHALSLARKPETGRSTPVWSTMPGWGPDPSSAVIHKEEARRLVWSALAMLSLDGATRLATGEQQLDLHISRAENFALLYPGEDAYSLAPEVDAMYSGKESNWALVGRTMLLFWTCVRQLHKFRVAPGFEELREEAKDFERRVWMELVALEEALDAHTCNIEQSTMYQARDFIISTRLLLSGGYLQSMQRVPKDDMFVPLGRDHLIRWLRRESNLGRKAYTVMLSANDNPLHILMVSRSHLALWAVAQMWRFVELWKLDNSLIYAIEVALSFIPLLRIYEKVWPCPEERRHGAKVIEELTVIRGLLGKKMSL
ncbi:hypothetical protein FRB94_013599 [Tulasnella sp. JGI-2019a]|nr:hypothetical protein FRB94_013599 [Tulasnella sp. JGI-2019a]